ncbi:hypothetical protein ACFQY0_09745 [Haloferula chungangensis]|uniref:PEP-CTERM sorting domain-containing protein n=1 Tax=Haloferula chungangensis TaxID=1048331 RepID=A0ABW2L7K6_9BACT
MSLTHNSTIRNLFTALLVAGLAAPSASAVVVSGTSSAVGIDVGITAAPIVEPGVGASLEITAPDPTTTPNSGTAPDPYNVTKNIVALNVSSALGSVAATSGSTHFHSDVDGASGNRVAVGTSSIAAVGVALLSAPGVPDLLSLSAETIASTSTSSGDYNSLSSTGTTNLVNLMILIEGLEISLDSNPAPNTTVYAGTTTTGIFGLSVILNEQITVGDGSGSTGITTNAIHIILDSVTYGGVSGISGDIIIGQSSSLLLAEVPEISQAAGVGILLSFAFFGRRRS